MSSRGEEGEKASTEARSWDASNAAGDPARAVSSPRSRRCPYRVRLFAVRRRRRVGHQGVPTIELDGGARGGDDVEQPQRRTALAVDPSARSSTGSWCPARCSESSKWPGRSESGKPAPGCRDGGLVGVGQRRGREFAGLVGQVNRTPLPESGTTSLGTSATVSSTFISWATGSA